MSTPEELIMRRKMIDDLKVGYIYDYPSGIEDTIAYCMTLYMHKESISHKKFVDALYSFIWLHKTKTNVDNMYKHDKEHAERILEILEHIDDDTPMGDDNFTNTYFLITFGEALGSLKYQRNEWKNK